MAVGGVAGPDVTIWKVRVPRDSPPAQPSYQSTTSLPTCSQARSQLSVKVWPGASVNRIVYTSSAAPVLLMVIAVVVARVAGLDEVRVPRVRGEEREQQ
jgi:hypothetical protein